MRGNTQRELSRVNKANMPLGKLFLIPCPISDDSSVDTLPLVIQRTVAELSHFLVENEKSARQFLRLLDKERDLRAITLIPLNEHTLEKDIAVACQPLIDGNDMGVISEAGCPGVADPGAEAVRFAHSIGAKVVPLVGPNSMLLALMASGFNGQRWRFVGYPPRKEPDRSKFLQELFSTAKRLDETQLVMDAPYRTDLLLQDLVRCGPKESSLCIACNLGSPSERIERRTLGAWKEDLPKLHKIPSVFVIGK